MTTPPLPPQAKTIPQSQIYHGQTYLDNYAWLRERENPEVLAYLEAENAYTEQVMVPTAQLQATLYQEILGRIKETDLSVPVWLEGYYYYTRTEAGQAYPIHCRKKESLDAPEQVLLDQNLLALGHAYFSLGTFEISPDHQLLAYATDLTGGETYTLFVKNLATEAILAQIPNIYTSVAWANDNATIFYTILDPAMRPFQLYRHRLGTDFKNDVLIYHEPDEAYYLGVDQTKDRAYLLLSLSSKITNEIYYLNADTPTEAFQVMQPRIKGLEYGAEHHEGYFYIVTNDQAQNFKLVRTTVTQPGREYWQDVIPHRPEVKFEGIDVFAEYFAVFEREQGLPRLRILDLARQEFRAVPFEEPVYTLSGGSNPDFKSTVLRFSYTSLITPNTVFDYDMTTGERELKKQTEVLGGYDPDQYQSERLQATAPDGTLVPISLVYKKGLVLDGKNPLYLYGYGSYGINIEPQFSSQRISILDRGLVFAIAHIRGGEDLGRAWYEDGKFLNKKNTFTDFIACAEHLIQTGYTNPEQLVIAGGSAGGLLMGGVMNLRPDLFKAVIAQVPFVDVVNTMMDSTLPLTVIEYDEWGDPNDPVFFDYMASYSPYDNLESKAYPNLLVTAGLNDPRVSYWEPAKWTAKLRALKTDQNRILLKTNLGAGHGGASGRYERIKEVAFEYAFMLDVLGLATS
ncbi:S9 family peptidase [Candidatus Cyanaurora vandensis]|uniref:S9 family peptidase n=1 Tax=Candidatus Cyanaurora vandensis TaxID=2714958 RepID=UPI0025802834|nr:S9 family peptidase [Candidatus Cyanaurora vandensis]